MTLDTDAQISHSEDFKRYAHKFDFPPTVVVERLKNYVENCLLEPKRYFADNPQACSQRIAKNLRDIELLAMVKNVDVSRDLEHLNDKFKQAEYRFQTPLSQRLKDNLPREVGLLFRQALLVTHDSLFGSKIVA